MIVRVFQEGPYYVAECYSPKVLHLVTQAKSIPDLFASLGRVFAAQEELERREGNELPYPRLPGAKALGRSIP
jgi:hypothetical protein